MAAGEAAVRWLGGYLERVATWQVDRATPPRGDLWALPLRSRASSERRAAGVRIPGASSGDARYARCLSCGLVVSTVKKRKTKAAAR